MSQVYSGSSLTIAAGSSTDCSKGIFSDQGYGLRTKGLSFQGDVVYALPLKMGRDESHLKGPLDMGVPNPSMRRTALTWQYLRDLPLARRSWTVQESLVPSHHLLQLEGDVVGVQLKVGMRMRCDKRHHRNGVSSRRLPISHHLQLSPRP